MQSLSPNGNDFSDFLNDLTGGDEKSWNLFIDEFHGLIAATAARCSRSHGEAIIPEIYRALTLNHFLQLRQFNGDSKPALFVFVRRVAENVAATFLRERLRPEAQLAELLAAMTEDRPEPEAIFLGANDKEKLAQAVGALRQDYRDVLTLLLKGFSHAEAAQILNIAVSDSLTRANRAVMILKKVLDLEKAVS